jgi:hypothetical protein
MGTDRIYIVVRLETSMTVWGISNIPIPVVWWAPASRLTPVPINPQAQSRVDLSGGIVVALVSVGPIRSTGAAREEASRTEACRAKELREPFS